VGDCYMVDTCRDIYRYKPNLNSDPNNFQNRNAGVCGTLQSIH
jgi:hypothetical protein